jgi:hypothetical protein
LKDTRRKLLRKLPSSDCIIVKTYHFIKYDYILL